MKRLKALIAIGLLVAFGGYAADLSEADKKWSAAVEKMIASGATRISTPDENRAKIAADLAQKYGRQSKTEKTDAGYAVTIVAQPAVQTAKKTE